MLMPIVSMNKMAMNESLATACCYREVAAPTNVMWETLHGGWIGNGYVNTKIWLDSSYSAWTVLGYDVNNLGTDPLPHLQRNYNAPAGTYTWEAFDGVGFVGMDAFFASNAWGFTRGSACTHSDPAECNYFTIAPEYVTNYHWESKTSHDTPSGTAWAQPHEAGQWSS